jgi:hypothetical protein
MFQANNLSRCLSGSHHVAQPWKTIPAARLRCCCSMQPSARRLVKECVAVQCTQLDTCSVAGCPATRYLGALSDAFGNAAAEKVTGRGVDN